MDRERRSKTNLVLRIRQLNCVILDIWYFKIFWFSILFIFVNLFKKNFTSLKLFVFWTVLLFFLTFRFLMIFTCKWLQEYPKRCSIKLLLTLRIFAIIYLINLTFCFIYNDRTISDWRSEIENFLKNFIILYPGITPTPKMHFLVHFPNQMKLFCLLRLHCTMRLEAKKRNVKKNKLKNFKNICKSVAFRQEICMVSKRGDQNWSDQDNFLSKVKRLKSKI